MADLLLFYYIQCFYNVFSYNSFVPYLFIYLFVCLFFVFCLFIYLFIYYFIFLLLILFFYFIFLVQPNAANPAGQTTPTSIPHTTVKVGPTPSKLNYVSCVKIATLLT